MITGLSEIKEQGLFYYQETTSAYSFKVQVPPKILLKFSWGRCK